MQVRQEYEFIIFPKVFSILNFYSKGLYSLQISLTAQNQQTGQIIKAFPFILQNQDAMKNTDKKSRIIIKDNKISYSSQNFYVTFSSQNFYFNTMPYFKIQLQRKKSYKLCVQFHLILTSYKITKNKEQNLKSQSIIKNSSNSNYISLNTIDEKVTLMDKKIIYLNNLHDTNAFHRILFSEPDFFSYTDVFIYSIKTSTKLRLHKFNFYEFYSASIEERSKFHTHKPESLKGLLRTISQGLTFQFCWYFDQGMYPFYRQMIQQPIKQYKRLVQVYQSFRISMITLNNSTISEDIKIPFLQKIGKFDLLTADKPINQQQFKYLLQQYYQTQNDAQIYLQIIHQSQLITKNIKFIFDHLCNLIIKINYNVFQSLSQPVIKQKWQQKYKKIVYHGDITREKRDKHTQFIKLRQQYCRTQKIVQDGDLKHPFIMLEGYQPYKQQNNFKRLMMPSYVIDNLVIFVHGYQGSDFDLEIAKYNLEMYNTHCYCLMSTSIQDEMDQSIEYLGLQLATQIREHITHSYNSYKRINFIGYSLGGILIRQSMRHLVEYKDKMNLFISLASPHTGTIDGGNFLIKTGIWYLINFQKSKNIKQLHCQFQGKQQQNFVLKKLSQCQSLNWFKKFIVVSSQQDSFVPYCSSRLDEIQSSTITKLMCENIKKRIKKFQRVQVWFDVDEEVSTIDKILGRKAHIEFLQNKVFLHCLFKLYSNQF